MFSGIIMPHTLFNRYKHLTESNIDEVKKMLRKRLDYFHQTHRVKKRAELPNKQKNIVNMVHISSIIL